MKTYHVTKTDDGWQGKAEGAGRASTTGSTKQEVTQRIIEIAKNQPEPVSVRIHKMDGKIQEERTYPGSADPRSSKG